MQKVGLSATLDLYCDKNRLENDHSTDGKTLYVFCKKTRYSTLNTRLVREYLGLCPAGPFPVTFDRKLERCKTENGGIQVFKVRIADLKCFNYKLLCNFSGQ